jgi:hypothetical protein
VGSLPYRIPLPVPLRTAAPTSTTTSSTVTGSIRTYDRHCPTLPPVLVPGAVMSLPRRHQPLTTPNASAPALLAHPLQRDNLHTSCSRPFATHLHRRFVTFFSRNFFFYFYFFPALHVELLLLLTATFYLFDPFCVTHTCSGNRALGHSQVVAERDQDEAHSKRISLNIVLVTTENSVVMNVV